MKPRFSIGTVTDFFSNVVWMDVASRIDGQLALLDERMEDPDPFKHGQAVGERRALKMVKQFPEIILNEAKGGVVYGGRNKGNGAPADVR
jgi:hypothetical protein